MCITTALDKLMLSQGASLQQIRSYYLATTEKQMFNCQHVKTLFTTLALMTDCN